jgi:hypothetical protein
LPAKYSTRKNWIRSKIILNLKQLFSCQNANTLMLDVAGKEYVTKEEEEPEDEAGGPDTEDQPHGEQEEDEEEEVVMSLGGGGDYAELMKKMDIIPCTVIVPKVRTPL